MKEILFESHKRHLCISFPVPDKISNISTIPIRNFETRKDLSSSSCKMYY